MLNVCIVYQISIIIVLGGYYYEYIYDIDEEIKVENNFVKVELGCLSLGLMFFIFGEELFGWVGNKSFIF